MKQSLIFKKFLQNEENEKLALWMCSDNWPYHGSSQPTLERVRENIKTGAFSSPDDLTFWVFIEGKSEPAGLLCLHEMTDDTPILDIRLKTEFRGIGLGPEIIEWLSAYIFTETDKERIEGHTRVDNIGMRKVFRQCGWVKEAHHRVCWPDSQGQKFDAITYAILKQDWINKTETPVNWDDEP